MDDWNIKIDIDEFLKKLGPLDEMSSKYLIIMISTLDIEDRKKILSREDIKNKLKFGILEESKNNLWGGISTVLNYITVGELISLYDVKTLNEFFKDGFQGREYILFSSMAKKNFDELIINLLNNEEMFNKMFEISDMFYSDFYHLNNYELFKAIILKMEQKDFPYSLTFINCISEELQREILKDNVSDKVIIALLPRLKKDIINEFFQNDPRALYLYDRLNIISYADAGITFNDDLLKKKKFFEIFFDKLSSKGFVIFREIINNMEKNNNVDIIERKLNQYYEDLISDIDLEAGLFKEYIYFLNNPEEYFRKDSYICSYDVVSAFSSHKDRNYGTREIFYENKEELIKELQKITSHKVSEIIIDALFQDNIYNVWLNIKEMLRYNSKLDEKILDNEREEFYKLILNFDNISTVEKVEMFHKLKDKSINLMFYDDLRRLKDASYELINDTLFNTSKQEYPKSEDMSHEYGVEIYDLRKSTYTMLIRGKHSHSDITGRRRNCYSIISNENTNRFGKEDGLIYYGYNSFDIDRVAHVLEQDSFSADIEDETPSKYVNRIMTPSEIVQNTSWYSEFDIVNPKREDGKYDAKKPDFVVAFDIITDVHIRESKRLNIPIVLVKDKKLDKTVMTDIPFDRETDIYVHDGYSETQVAARSSRR